MKRIQLICALAGFGLMGLGTLTYGAPPLANTPIGNQAKATFSDESGVQREVLSNTVITRVAQIYAVTLQQDNNRIATPGSQVYFPHTVINSGNGLDSFDLTRILTGTNLLNVAIYPDANQDGLPDNQTPITVTPGIEPGEGYSFVVAGIVPPTAAVDATGGATVTATSVGDTNATKASATNNDAFTVTNNAVMQVTKAIDIITGKPPVDGAGGVGEITYTITYSNTGNSSATDFTITDRIPDGMIYVPGSARWHRTGSTALTDGIAGDPAGINYDFGVTEAGEATYVIDEVARGESGYVTFKVTLADRQVPGTITNTANYEFKTGGDPAPKGPYPTNQVPFTVEQVPAVTLTPPAVPHPAVPAGSTVVWTNVVENKGTGIDTFDIIIDTAGHSFPAGTNFLLFQSDGQTPMVDSNGNGIPDTGPLAVGATYDVVLKAILPLDAGAAPGPHAVTKTARSAKDPLVSDSGTDELVSITAASVNLTDTVSIATATDAQGSAIYATAHVSNVLIGGAPIALNPGQATTLNLVVNNTGDRPDSYNLLASMALPFTSTSNLRPGWTVTFRNSASTSVSNTGTIGSGANAPYTAEVRVPANEVPGIYEFYVQIKSPVTGAIDHARYQIEVNTVRNITLETNNIGQTFPGGSIEFEHVLTNRGNVVEGSNDGSGSGSVITVDLVDSLAASGFSSIVYYDANGNGTLDASDTVLTGTTLADLKPAGLAIGESVRLFVKVFAPLGIAESATNQTTVTATTTGVIAIAAPAPAVNVDTTTIVRGDLIVEKRQAIDTDGNGDIDGGEGPFVQTQLSAPPGAIIIYQIIVKNTGSADATGITVNDAIPANTTYLGTGAKGTAIVTGGTAVETIEAGAPAAGGTGAFQFNVGTLQPQESATIYFGVKINE